MFSRSASLSLHERHALNACDSELDPVHGNSSVRTLYEEQEEEEEEKEQEQEQEEQEEQEGERCSQAAAAVATVNQGQVLCTWLSSIVPIKLNPVLIKLTN